MKQAILFRSSTILLLSGTLISCSHVPSNRIR